MSEANHNPNRLLDKSPVGPTELCVTAGIDFGLQIVAALRGGKYAKAIQIEYNPAPPFDSGSPKKADAFSREAVKEGVILI